MGSHPDFSYEDTIIATSRQEHLRFGDIKL